MLGCVSLFLAQFMICFNECLSSALQHSRCSLDCSSGWIPLDLGPRCSSATDDSAVRRSLHSASMSSLDSAGICWYFAVTALSEPCAPFSSPNLGTSNLFTFSGGFLGLNHRCSDATRGRWSDPQTIPPNALQSVTSCFHFSEMRM